jgi:hypothetical protein
MFNFGNQRVADMKNYDNIEKVTIKFSELFSVAVTNN